MCTPFPTRYHWAWHGLCFVVFLLLFCFLLIKESRKENLQNVQEEIEVESSTPIFKAVLLMMLSVLLLSFGADFLIDGTILIAQEFGFTERIISVSLVAIGTSIPELATSLVAAFKKEENLAVGNLIGSNIFNIGSVLGITAIIKPIQIAQEIIERDIIWMLFFALLLLFMVILPRRNDLGKLKGFFMLLLYFVFITLAFI